MSAVIKDARLGSKHEYRALNVDSVGAGTVLRHENIALFRFILLQCVSFVFPFK
jgi:hypothetical protein